MSRDFILAAVATLSVSALTRAIALARGAIVLGGTGNNREWHRWRPWWDRQWHGGRPRRQRLAWISAPTT
jgi:hypothetical protein